MKYVRILLLVGVCTGLYATKNDGGKQELAQCIAALTNDMRGWREGEAARYNHSAYFRSFRMNFLRSFFKQLYVRQDDFAVLELIRQAKESPDSPLSE
jgi:hypothetical protein